MGEEGEAGEGGEVGGEGKAGEGGEGGGEGKAGEGGEEEEEGEAGDGGEAGRNGRAVRPWDDYSTWMPAPRFKNKIHTPATQRSGCTES